MSGPCRGAGFAVVDLAGHELLARAGLARISTAAPVGATSSSCFSGSRMATALAQIRPPAGCARLTPPRAGTGSRSSSRSRRRSISAKARLLARATAAWSAKVRSHAKVSSSQASRLKTARTPRISPRKTRGWQPKLRMPSSLIHSGRAKVCASCTTSFTRRGTPVAPTRPTLRTPRGKRRKAPSRRDQSSFLVRRVALARREVEAARLVGALRPHRAGRADVAGGHEPHAGQRDRPAGGRGRGPRSCSTVSSERSWATASDTARSDSGVTPRSIALRGLRCRGTTRVRDATDSWEAGLNSARSMHLALRGGNGMTPARSRP